jgi:hypothetical protein
MYNLQSEDCGLHTVVARRLGHRSVGYKINLYNHMHDSVIRITQLSWRETVYMSFMSVKASISYKQHMFS